MIDSNTLNKKYVIILLVSSIIAGFIEITYFNIQNYRNVNNLENIEKENENEKTKSVENKTIKIDDKDSEIQKLPENTELVDELEKKDNSQEVKNTNSPSSNEIQSNKSQEQVSQPQPEPKQEEKIVASNEESNFNSQEQEEPIILVTSSDIEEIETLEEKYGTKKNKVTLYNLKTYSDGSTQKEYIRNYIIYDRSGFNGTTNDMKAEAIQVVNQNINIYKDVLLRTNGYRNSVEISDLVLDNNLCIAATIRAIELAYSVDVTNISHTRPNGSNPNTVADELGISWTDFGENIAAGYNTVEKVITAWYNSPGHRSNMEDSRYQKLGVGYYELNGSKYWVQLFSN